MIINQLSIREYLSLAGVNSFRTWLGAQPAPVIARVHARLLRVEIGNLGDTRSVGHGVQEMRIDYGPGIRIYFGRQGNAVILVLCGGDKRSQRTDIVRARRYWLDYLSRTSHDT